MKFHPMLLLAALLVSGACSSGERGDSGRDTLTQRQRDSLIGELPIPGARGVRGAMEAADSARARQRLLDSIGG